MPKQNQRARTVPLREGEFTARPYVPGDDGIVLTTQVPSNQVWQVPAGETVTVALIQRQDFTVSEGVTGQTIDLTPEAPKVDYMDDWAAGQYTGDAYIYAEFDSDGDGAPDTMVTDTTTVQYNGAYTEDGDFIDTFDVDETSANTASKEVSVYVVARYGQAKLSKRNTAGNSQTLKGEDMLRYAFSSPHDPDSDRRTVWDRGIGGLKGVIPPKFKFDVVYFDTNEDIHVEDASAENLQIHIPVNQRPLADDEEPKALRRRVTNAMARQQ